MAPAAAICSSTTRCGPHLCSEDQLRQAAARGLDAKNLARRYADAINESAQGEAGGHGHHHACLPRQLPLHLDLRRRLRAEWQKFSSASLNYDGYSWNTTAIRAGGLEPLRFPPKGNKQVVVGLVTSKSGTL